MSRILIDLPDSLIDDLAVIVKAEQRPRVAVIHDAIETYISQRKRAQEEDVFGLWKSRKIDSIAYQQELRTDW